MMNFNTVPSQVAKQPWCLCALKVIELNSRTCCRPCGNGGGRGHSVLEEAQTAARVRDQSLRAQASPEPSAKETQSKYTFLID